MRIAVTGATGFVGSHAVRRFINGGHDLVAIARDEPPEGRLPEPAVFRQGDVARPDSLKACFDGCEVVVNLVGIIKEVGSATFEDVHARGARNIVEAARACGIRRVVQVSAVGARAGAPSRYHQTKWEGEEHVRGSGLQWVVLRPSLIFGKGEDFTAQYIRIIRKAPIIPVIGPGDRLMQPIAVEDVCAALLGAAEQEEHSGQTYEMGGPERIQFKKIVKTIARQMGSHKPMVHFPAGIMKPLSVLMSKIAPSFPLGPDQITMLQEDNIAEPNHAQEVFGLKLTTLQEGLKRILASDS